ncbi:hypothetical protein Tco_0617894 [Tanacetum coccineum]
MSDSDESGVTYTEISSTFEELSDIGSPGVVPSPDYIPGPEEPQSPPLPDFVPEPVYPEYMPQEDEMFPAEEQPLPVAASPTAQSPDYVPESDPEADPEEDDDEDPEEDPVDYPADGGDDGDDEDESSEDDEDEEVDIEADDEEEEEEEHPTLVMSLPTVLAQQSQIRELQSADRRRQTVILEMLAAWGMGWVEAILLFDMWMSKGHFKRECTKLLDQQQQLVNLVGGGQCFSQRSMLGRDAGTNQNSQRRDASRVECLLEDRPKVGLPPTEGSRRKHSEDRLTRYGHYEFQVMPFGLTNAHTAVFMDTYGFGCLNTDRSTYSYILELLKKEVWNEREPPLRVHQPFSRDRGLNLP